MSRPRAPRNRTIVIPEHDRKKFEKQIGVLSAPATRTGVINRIFCQDIFQAAPFLPAKSADLLVVDPPYNKTISYNASVFRKRPHEAYVRWVESWLCACLPTLSANASVYICADWQSSRAVQEVAERHLIVRNRITWEREKGRGALRNWKNCSEDIWFCTVGNEYTFNLDQVKLKRRVVAPYTDGTGRPKDWQRNNGGAFRVTHPSNLWTDLTVPFWSMNENTDHPAQKPEKMLAKIILASSNPGDVVLDPFLGSGTTAVVAKKLGRKYIGVEQEREYCLLATKRLADAEKDNSIQGFDGEMFMDRNMGR